MRRPPEYVATAVPDEYMDGDSFYADLVADLGFNRFLTFREEIRLADVDAVERNTPGGPGATAALRRLLYDDDGHPRPLVITTKKVTRGRHTGDESKSAGRYVADVAVVRPGGDGTFDVAAAMVAQGYAERVR